MGRRYDKIRNPMAQHTPIPTGLITSEVSDPAFRCYAMIAVLGEMDSTLLAEALGVHRNTVYGYINELKRKGWITDTYDSEDKTVTRHINDKETA